MFRRILIVLLTFGLVLGAGWLTMRRGDIAYDRLEMVYADGNSRFLDFPGGLRVHYRDTGPRDAPVIVLVHGFSSSLHTWESWTADLKRDYRVISLDLPGHGLTNCGEAETIEIPLFVKTIDEVTTALGVDRFTLAGNSMGGGTAWAYALAHPERLTGLVLVDASGWPADDADRKKSPLVFKLLANPVARKVMKDLDMSALVRSGLRDSFADPALATDAMVDRYAALARAPCHRDAILALSAGQEDRMHATDALMAEITAPTLVMHGEQDNLIPVENGRRFAAAIKDAELKIYPAAGHLPQEEVPDASVADLRDFLARRVTLPGGAPADSGGGVAPAP